MGNCWPKPEDALPPTVKYSTPRPVINKHVSTPTASNTKTVAAQPSGDSGKVEVRARGKIITPNLKMFTLAELKSATRNFRPDTVLGEGGFGTVFKGWIDDKTFAPSKVGVGMPVAVKKSNHDSEQGLKEWQAEVKFLGKFSHPNLVKLIGYCWEEKKFLLVYEHMQKGSLESHLFRKGAEALSWDTRLKIAIGAARGLAFLHTTEKQVIYRDFKAANILLDAVVAIKQLNLDGLQGNQEFIVEVLMLSLLHHKNLVNLCGYCTDGDQRLLVYEFMPMGSLENHLFDLEPGKNPLSWRTRLKIAAGAAHGLEYLHCEANPPVIYRDLKSSNILLDNDFNPKLSDFGLAKLGPVGENTHVSTRVMGTYGYCAPEYAMSGKLTLKSDIYSLGVVLLELITGRKAYDSSRNPGEQNLVVWSRPFLKDRRKFVHMVDPLLNGQFSVRSLHHAVAITAMCIQEQANFRPIVSDIVVALDYLVSQAESSDSQGGGSQTGKQTHQKEN